MAGKQRRQWRSMCKGLILGTLLTSCMILLYCLPIQQAHFNPPEIPVPYSCAHRPSHLHPKISTNMSQKNSSQSCSPKVDIMFMKTHKTASSTFLNILFRFGEKHHLQFAFPNSRNDFFYPSLFQRSQVKDYKPGMCFNIICNHMRFNAPEVAKLLPLDTSYITILRDPAELFESSFHYFGRVVPFTWTIPGDDKLTEFLLDPHSYFDPEGFNSFYLKNLLFFDFGLDNTLELENPQVDEGIRFISERFHLVMLVEHFEESLILLKDALCWEMDDLLFFKLNARKGSTVSKLTPELRARALEWNAIDWKLYQHFNQTFWKKVNAYGRLRMAKDVAVLRKRNKEMASICIEGGHAVEAGSIQETDMQPWQPIGEKSIMGYNLKKNVDKTHRKSCRKMLMPEIQYLTELGVNLWITRLWGHVRNILNW
ncbi:galactosylceramide sulfotransferase [Poecilia reticulata]|uniref:Galactose-3-O-sulfotransferase 1a n=1 Tax=Poecilia reticulata TaxID=8081 RepID=A0A3P9QGW7_POERE|nr:PREDICTED: galactosylceramide sulfotransferase [Poecilia reticulata]XP_008416955.1 PREDICTED: galactosylceramide sulfotransferase [Poecilia reticulata]XP_017161972.1 PREDICTED: galactosylceramide sulfotransferase [Poecilia reticulata]